MHAIRLVYANGPFALLQGSILSTESCMFGRSAQPTCHLLLGNVGPGVGVQRDAIAAALSSLGCTSVQVPQLDDKEACYVFATFASQSAAAHARELLHDKPCADLGSRTLTAKYAALKAKGRATPGEASEQEHVDVCRTSEECGVPGLTLLPNFVSEAEEQELLSAVDEGQWDSLARRRVKHFGFEFRYLTRDVDPQQPIAPMPAPVAALLPRLRAAGGTDRLDQLTVNEYGIGVGLSPHIDTHSAFTGAILSLSLAGPAVMQFRRDGQRRAICLPRRSLLVLSGEARYAWDHYIPHRRQDVIDGEAIERAPRRVSLTFRQVRDKPCDCEWPHQCDSQLQQLPPTRNLLAAEAAAKAASGGSGHAAQPCQPHTMAAQLAQQLSAAAVLQGAGRATGRLSSGNQRSLGSACQQTGRSGNREAQRAAGDVAQRPAPVEAVANGCSLAADSSSAGADPEAACQQMEDRFVNDVYNTIAPHFNSTRFAVWPKVRAFLETFASGDVIADVGCGNGKYFGVRHDVAILASDRSSGLAEVAAARLSSHTGRAARADVAVADGFTLPYREGSCDGVLCIAVLHHISSEARRRRLLQRLCSILRPGGRALVTVWAYEQEEEKLLAKWQRIQQPPDGAAVTGRPVRGPDDSHSSSRASGAKAACKGSSTQSAAAGDDLGGSNSCGGTSVDGSGGDNGCGGGSNGGSLDYMVPWHLPFHRLEAAAVAARTVSASADAAGSAVDGEARSAPAAGAAPARAPAASAASGAAGSVAGQPFARIDTAKNTIVFERFYHLFRAGELEGLAAQVPDAVVVDSFFDKSNWCIVLQRQGTDGGSNGGGFDGEDDASGSIAAGARRPRRKDSKCD